MTAANPDRRYNQLGGIYSLPSGHAWVVGQSGGVQGAYARHAGTGTQFGVLNKNISTLTEHWDGSHWNLIPSPNIGLDSGLQAVAGHGARDLWTVGYAITSQHEGLIEHWDGTSWAISKIQEPAGDSLLLGVDVDSANDAWAVGYTAGSDGDNWWILHWTAHVGTRHSLNPPHQSLFESVVPPLRPRPRRPYASGEPAAPSSPTCCRTASVACVRLYWRRLAAVFRRDVSNGPTSTRSSIAVPDTSLMPSDSPRD